MPVRTKWIVATVVAVIALLVVLGTVVVALILALGKDTGWGKNQIALIHLSGVIAASSDGDLMADSGGANPERIINLLRKADRDSAVRAILLRVNSPGGTAAASQEISAEVRRTRKPVVVSVADIGASGAYMVSASADKIVAAPASDVGSIGVILEITDLERLANKLGIGVTVIKQGKYKDMGNPFRKVSPQERKILDAESKIVYEQFIGEVAEGRRLPLAKVRGLATGRTWVGTQAIQLGLVDRIGNMQDAIDLAARMGKIKGRPEVVTYETPSFAGILSQALGSMADGAAIGALRRAGLGDLSRRAPLNY